MKKTALLVIDLINEIIDANGALSTHGYAEYINQHKSVENINTLIDFCRNTGRAIPIFTKVEFSDDYREQLKDSPVFKDVDKFQIFKKNTWSTEIHPNINKNKPDIIVSKFRVSPFYGTNLKLILDNLRIEELILCGVSTHLAIESTVREAHDMGYSVVVINDCCIAGNETTHNNSIENMKNFSSIVNLEQFILNNK